MTMKWLILDLIFLAVATGLWVRAGGSIVSAGSIFFLLFFLLLIGQWRFPAKNNDTKHPEIKPTDKPKTQNTIVARTDGAGIETHSRPSGLAAQSSLLEAVGREAIAGQNLKLIGGRTLDYLSRYMRAETLLFLTDKRSSLEVLAARSPDADDLIGSVFKTEGNLAAIIADEKPVSLNMPNISAELKLEAVADSGNPTAALSTSRSFFLSNKKNEPLSD